MKKILVIDDDHGFLKSISNFLKYKNYDVFTISNPLDAKNIIEKESFDCILCDVKMPGMDGITLFKNIQRQVPHIPVIMVSGQSSISIAVEAIRHGAYDFIEKSSDSERLLITIENAIIKKSLSEEKGNLLAEISDNYKIVGQSKIILDLMRQIKIVAPTNAKVLIRGETGTGKELVARALHLMSKRNVKPFIKINCAAIPETLLETELFGHKKGSFTGATHDKIGKFQAANGGTLFLDEIGDLSLVLQAKLLRVLQDGEIEVIGMNQSLPVDVRIIAATNKPLEELVTKGDFREDIFHRLNVVTISVPSLGERKEDIPLLSTYFLKKFSEEYNKKLLGFSNEALTFLIENEWKGNIRELKNFIEKLSIFSQNTIIEISDVIQQSGQQYENSDEPSSVATLRSKIEDFEKNYITQSLNIFEGKIGQTAKYLDIDRTTLFKKMQKYNI